MNKAANLLLPMVLLALRAYAQTPNLVANPGFEARAASGLPEAWDGPASVYSHVASPVHSGTGAMQFVNPDPANYALCRQTIPLKPGRMYEFSVWAKCEDIVGTDTGATICLEWYTQDDKYLGGAYPAGIKGTKDWTRIKATGGRVPQNAAKCYVLCYVRQKMTGKAWWDDVEVRQYLEPPLQTMLLQPNYRGLITPQTKRIELAAELKLEDYDLKPDHVELRVTILRLPEDVLSSKADVVKQVTAAAQGPVTRVSLPTANLTPGPHLLQVALLKKGASRELAHDQWRLTVVPEGDLQQRTAYIDEHNRLLLNGRPFFPLGMYWSGISEDDMKLYADSAFNCLMPYGMPTQEQMDLAQRHGLKVIYSVKDIYAGTAYAPKDLTTPEDERAFIEAKTKQFADHPALLAWYLNDELSIDHMPSLEAHQEWMEELDPNHPTWIVLYQVGQLELYRKTFDVLGTDPYPIPRQPARQAANYTIKSRESVMESRPLWQVPQVMNWACYRKTEEEKQGLRPPTFDEMRSMTWQCITEGAMGLIYYSWFDLKKEPEVFDQRWRETKQVAAEVQRWAPVLLSVEPTPKIQAERQEWLHWMTRRVGNEVYLFAVNDEDQPHEARFELPRGVKAVRVEGEDEALTPGKSLQMRLQPFELRVYRLQL